MKGDSENDAETAPALFFRSREPHAAFAPFFFPAESAISFGIAS
jgi:hypothetical protein